MNDQNTSPTLPPLPRITWWLIWGALLNAVIVYAVVLQVSPPEPAGDENSWLMLRNILLGVAIVAVVASFGIRLFVTTRIADKNDPGGVQKMFASYIVSLALSESAAIFGLVIAFMGAPLSEYLAFFVIGGLGLIAQPPTFLPPARTQ